VPGKSNAFAISKKLGLPDEVIESARVHLTDAEEDFEDVIRTAVSLGGDCDTLTCISGSIAEAFYGVPEHLKAECENRLPKDLREVLVSFKRK
jgi:ADP-ribosylglycohydrolase